MLNALRTMTLGLAALFLASIPAPAADMEFSVGPQFVPGIPMFYDLNVMVDRVNGLSDGSYPATCTVTGATPQDCDGQRGVVTTDSLTTAAVTAATYVINNDEVTAASLVTCQVLDYSGTLFTNGLPEIFECVPGAGTITVGFANTHGTNALSGTLTIGFAVLN